MRERGFPVFGYPAARHRTPRPRAGSLRWPPYQYSARGSAFPSAACSNHAIRARISAIRRSSAAKALELLADALAVVGLPDAALAGRAFAGKQQGLQQAPFLCGDGARVGRVRSWHGEAVDLHRAAVTVIGDELGHRR